MSQITIAGHQFDIPERYTVGHVLNESETNALNQLLSDKARNAIGQRIKASLAEGQESPTWNDENIAKWQDEISSYVKSHQFGVRSGGGGRTVDLETKYALEEASEAVVAAYRNGHQSVPKGKDLKEIAMRVLEGPQGDRFRQLARARIRSVQKEAAGLMDNLVHQLQPAA